MTDAPIKSDTKKPEDLASIVNSNQTLEQSRLDKKDKKLSNDEIIKDEENTVKDNGSKSYQDEMEIFEQTSKNEPKEKTSVDMGDSKNAIGKDKEYSKPAGIKVEEDNTKLPGKEINGSEMELDDMKKEVAESKESNIIVDKPQNKGNIINIGNKDDKSNTKLPTDQIQAAREFIPDKNYKILIVDDSESDIMEEPFSDMEDYDNDTDFYAEWKGKKSDDSNQRKVEEEIEDLFDLCNFDTDKTESANFPVPAPRSIFTVPGIT